MSCGSYSSIYYIINEILLLFFIDYCIKQQILIKEQSYGFYYAFYKDFTTYSWPFSVCRKDQPLIRRVRTPTPPHSARML